MHQGALFAVRFDLNRLETIGQAASALQGLTSDSRDGSAQVALSSEGTLVYVPGADAATTAGAPIGWMTRDGNTSVLRGVKAAWANPRFSPDGKTIAIDISDGKQSDIWVYDWTRDTVTRVTDHPAQDLGPVWTHDGKRIVFASDRFKHGIFNLYWVNADGTGDVMRLTDSENGQKAGSWDPTDRFLAFQENRAAATRRDLMILPMEGDAARGWTPGTPTVFLSTPAMEQWPMFSPDGRWIAYLSDEAGAGWLDLYVQPFPGPGAKVRVSTAGALNPHWSATAHELLFGSPGPYVTAAPYVVIGDSFRAEKPKAWSPTKYAAAYDWDLNPDGKRLAILPVQAQDQDIVVQDKVVFVFNFFDYLWKIAPGNK